MLIARHAEDGDFAAKLGCCAKICGAVAHVWQLVHRDVEAGADRFVPAAFADVIKHGARGVCGIGRVNCAPCEVPDEEAVDGAKQQVFGAVHGLQNVAQFRA